MPSPGPQARARREEPAGDHSPPTPPHTHHCPRLQPTPRPRGGRCGSGDPGRRNLALSRAPPAGKWGAGSGGGGRGDKCQRRRPGARLHRPGAAPSAQPWYSPLGAPPPATLPARSRRRRRDQRLLAAPPRPPRRRRRRSPPPDSHSPRAAAAAIRPRRRQQTSFSGLPAPPPGPKHCSQSQVAPL